MAEPSEVGSGWRLGPPAENAYISEKNSSLPALISHTVTVWVVRRRRRRELRDLAGRNDRLLADVGLTLEEALREARKPFWQR